jgi:L-glutamine-phosphate cytidylyltransferase
MEAIILLAGRGTRLHAFTQGLPKCYVEIGGQTLLQRNEAFLRARGCEILPVVGYQAKKVLAGFQQPVSQWVVNPMADTTNTLVSLWMALKQAKGPVICLNGDTVFDEEVLDRLLQAPGDVRLACGRLPCGWEEVKYIAEAGAVKQISKDIEPIKAHGESIGVGYLNEKAIAAFIALADELFAHGLGAMDYYERVFDRLCAQSIVDVQAVDISGLRWCEIDFPEDYSRAQEMFAPVGA